MVRLIRPSIAALVLLALSACYGEPEFPSDPDAVDPAARTTCEGVVADIIGDIFPPGLGTAALSQCANVQRKFADGDVVEATEMAHHLIDFALQHAANGQLQDPPVGTLEEALAELIAGILGDIGISASSSDVAVGFYDETSDEELITPSGHAGIAIDPDDFSGPATAAIFPLSGPMFLGQCPFSFDPPNDCYPLYFDFSVQGKLQNPINVGFCVLDPGTDPFAPPNETVLARLQIASESGGSLVFWPTSTTLAPDGVDCSDLAFAPGGWQGDVWRAMGPLARLLEVRPAWANPGSLGGSISSFSHFAAVDPVVPSACPATSDFVATDESTLNAVLADSAAPGDVIALDGTIALTGDVVVDVANLTLTCHTPGSGLEVAPAAIVQYLLRLQATDVRVERLELDAVDAQQGPVLAVDAPISHLSGAQLVANEVTCGPAVCAFFVGVRDILIAENHFSSIGVGSNSGIHVQGAGPLDVNGRFTFTTDDTVVKDNLVATNLPSGSPLFGGIRVRDGTGIRVERNMVSGAWQNSVATSEFVAGFVRMNVLAGPELRGIFVSSNPFTAISTESSVFNQNRVTGAGEAGIRVEHACFNDFVTNDLSGNAGNLGIFFDTTTGANFVNGTNGALVVDNGAFDCDGDAVNDPNTVVGAPAPALVPSFGAAVEARTPGYAPSRVPVDPMVLQ